MVNNDLRNFAKSSTNLDQIEGVILASSGAGGDDHQGTRSLKKDRGVIFKDEPAAAPDERTPHARIAVDDDVDSVQHLDLSVIDDNQHDGF